MVNPINKENNQLVVSVVALNHKFSESHLVFSWGFLQWKIYRFSRQEKVLDQKPAHLNFQGEYRFLAPKHLLCTLKNRDCYS
jgi:hypothetical protein